MIGLGFVGHFRSGPDKVHTAQTVDSFRIPRILPQFFELLLSLLWPSVQSISTVNGPLSLQALWGSGNL